MRRSAAPILTFIGCLTLYQGLARPDDSRPEDSLPLQDRTALEILRARPPWLFPADACPADVMPAAETRLYYYPETCKADLAACAVDCQTNDANACFALALAVQALKRDDPVSEALFLRACRLGLPTACTNRAAGMAHLAPESAAANACAARTFAATCKRNDPWGCTMYGFHLMRGVGVKKDLGMAAHMFRRACRIDAAFEACLKGKPLLKQIEDAEGPQPEPPD
jgi:TPR repeat protein